MLTASEFLEPPWGHVIEPPLGETLQQLASHCLAQRRVHSLGRRLGTEDFPSLLDKIEIEIERRTPDHAQSICLIIGAQCASSAMGQESPAAAVLPARM
jgi:hypothetical protein